MLHRDVKTEAVQGIIDHNTANPDAEAAGPLVGAMASVSMDDLTKIDADSQLEQHLLKSDDENGDQMEVDPSSAQAAALDAELNAPTADETKSFETKNGENSISKDQSDPSVKIEVDSSSIDQSAVPVDAKKGFQNDADSINPPTGANETPGDSVPSVAPTSGQTQEGFQNDAPVEDGRPPENADSDGDIVMAPTVFGSFTMADLTIQNPTDAESILIDSFQGSIKLLLDILGTDKKK